MKNNMGKYNLNEGNEALNRVLLMMKYDSKKTLTENKGIILENTNCENSIPASDAIKKIKEVSEIFQTLEGFISQEWVDDDTEAKELYDIVSEIVGHNIYDELNDTCEEGVKFLKKTFKSTQLSKSWTITWFQETDIIAILNNLIKGFFEDKADIRRYLEATKRIIENPKKIKKTDDSKKTGNGENKKQQKKSCPVVTNTGVVYKYEYPGDTTYVYGIKDARYYAKNRKTGKEFKIHDCYPETVKKLNAGKIEIKPEKEGGKPNVVVTDNDTNIPSTPEVGTDAVSLGDMSNDINTLNN